jgi:hypothetical protein
LEVQGIAVDPLNLGYAMDRLIAVLEPGYGNGVDKFDCFLSYRVAADKDVVEKLYLMLRLKNVHPFLDRKCLRDGEPWKDGFLRALQCSRTFVAVMSSAALARPRQRHRDHSNDNVLIEYETALRIVEALPNRKNYVVPMFMGEVIQNDQGTSLKMFSGPDLWASSYSPSVLAVPEAVAPVAVVDPAASAELD